MLVESAKAVAMHERPADPTAALSDRLGVLFAKTAILDTLWDKLGKAFGAKTLSTVATRSIGRDVRIEDAKLSVAAVGLYLR